MKKVIIPLVAILLMGQGCPWFASKSPEASESAVGQSAKAPSEKDKAEAYEKAEKYEGEWVGGWYNTTFGSRGATKASAKVNPDGTWTATIDIDGLVFGTINPKPKTYSGTYDKNGVTLKATKDDLFGDLVVTVDKDGNIKLESSSIPIKRVKTFTAQGKITQDKVDMTYNVNFPAGNFAKGIFNLTKQK